MNKGLKITLILLMSLTYAVVFSLFITALIDFTKYSYEYHTFDIIQKMFSLGVCMIFFTIYFGVTIKDIKEKGNDKDKKE